MDQSARCERALEPSIGPSREAYACTTEPLSDHIQTGHFRFVHLLVREADLCDRRDVLLWNIPFALSPVSLDLAPLLRRVIRVGEPPLGLALRVSVGRETPRPAHHRGVENRWSWK